MRGDVQAAIVAASAFQARGGKVSAADLLPQWQAPPAPDPEAEEEAAAAAFRALLEARAQ